ncbi:MAG TPA: aminotransferase class IV [Polyangiaceae bacterium]|jgi:D-alanine transaminase|nr:aminotransferase class IV [Polyangiaceae bacterium]
MASRPRFAWCNGRIVPYGEAAVPLDDRGLQFGESLYEVLPITKGIPRLLPEHVSRMTRGATELGLETGVPSLTVWEALIRDLVEREGLGDALLYAQVTGGATPREHAPAVDVAKTFFAYLMPFVYPGDSEVAAGIAAISLPDIRWGRRDLKTTMLLAAVLAKKEARRRGAAEAVLVGPNGEVYEGASSNVFIVEGRSLVTPEQTTNLLPGTMRGLVVDVAREAGLDCRGEPFDLGRLRRADEVLVTSTSQLVMPVVALDGVPIGPGTAGPVGRHLAKRLRERFDLPG